MTNSQSKIEQLLTQLCPDGVEFKSLEKIDMKYSREKGFRKPKKIMLGTLMSLT